MKRASLLLLAIAGCAGGSVQRSDPAAELAARLAGATFGRVPGPPVQCVEVADLRTSRGLGGGLLLFDGAEGRQWVNRVPNCPALTYGRTIRLAAPVARLCRGGGIEVLDAGRPIATCTVGDFLSYVPRQ